MDLQSLINTMAEQDRVIRSKYHVTLGGLISTLENVGSGKTVLVKETGKSVNSPHSYRGYYSDLAFEESDEKMTVGDFVTLCKNAVGTSYVGYKGGDFIMGEDTPLWISHYGCCGSAVIGIEESGDVLYICTKYVD